MAKKERKPKVGDVVLYYPHESDKTAFSNGHPGPIAAIITRVWSDTTVNLKIIPDCGAVEDRSSVTFGTSKYNWSWT